MGGDPDLEDFPPVDRFEARGRLGAGGMGTVWAAWDRELGIEVALKTLRIPEPHAIYRFKREFRALADVTHPNLVTLYELFASEGQWLFTMELLEGLDFVQHVRGDGPGSGSSRSTSEDDPTLAAAEVTTPAEPAAPDPSARASLPDLDRLRAAMEQLVDGVMALHAAGWLHRDIKPSNVLVTGAGRVVLLDFGVVAEMASPSALRDDGVLLESPSLELVGTPSFMSPEQARGEVVGPASDWYSVGLLLYQTLTGRRAFAARGARLLEEKQLFTPPPLRVLCPDVPPSLDELCAALLDRDPAARPTGRDILSVLRRGRRPSSHPFSRPPPPDEHVPLVGRAAHIERLRDALERARRGDCQVAFVHGTSGSGKTSLVSQFLEEVRALEGAIVLAGRCYERESVPFKAVDSVVDELCELLIELPLSEVRRYVPDGAPVLAQMFPVLRRVDAIPDSPRRELGGEDLPRVRRRAFAALREMLGRIGEARPLVVFIDDMQWGDADSARLLEALVRPPDAPPLLLLGSYRTDERDRSPLLTALLDGHGVIARRHREVALGPLSPRDAESLAVTLLASAGADVSIAAAVARESEGNPYFIHELVRFAQLGELEPGRTVGLEEVIRARVGRLPPPERELLEVVAVAGQPLPQRVAHEAAGMEPSERPAAVQHLGRSQLLRTSGTSENDAIECYHDRIRETVVAALPPERLQRWHRRLADALEAAEMVDAETLVDHLRAAGEHDRAARYAVQAAEQATAALSFGHAAELYRLALSLRPDAPPEEMGSLRARLGDALAYAGRGVDSARAYLDAASVTGAPQAVQELRRRAGEQYLRAGYVEEGLVIVRELLGKLGIRMPVSPAATIALLLYHRAALGARGLGFVERPSEEVSEHDRMLADVCLTVATGLVQVDALRGSLFGTRAVREALRIGDRARASRALFMEALMRSSRGARARTETGRYMTAAEEIGRPLGDPHTTAISLAARGVAAFEMGDFGESYETCERGLDEFRRLATGSFWELGTTELFSALAQLFTARFDLAARLTPGRVAAAEERGDVYTATCLRAAITPILHLTADDPAAARREGEEALALWRIEEFQNQHHMAFVAQSFTDLYSGDLESAVARCDRTAVEMRASLLKHVQVIRASWRLTESLCLLAGAANGVGDPGALLRRVRQNARRLAREGATYCDGGAAMLRAGLALRGSRRDEAIRELERARELFARCDMGLFGDPCEWRIATLRGGEEGAARARAVEERWRARGVLRPERLLSATAIPL